jgi:hypothetical protein
MNPKANLRVKAEPTKLNLKLDLKSNSKKSKMPSLRMILNLMKLNWNFYLNPNVKLVS